MSLSGFFQRTSAAFFLLALCAAPLAMRAQENAHQSAKVLFIVREMTKPGKDGNAHQKTESAYVKALTDSKSSIHYTALTSMTGTPRALFLSGYPTFEAMEAEHKAVSPALGMALDKANLADGENLSETADSAWVRRDDLSTNTLGAPGGTRYMEVSQYVVKPGHEKEFEELAKLYVKGFKNIPEVHWTAYQLMYGMLSGPAYLTLTAHKSLSGVDAEMAADAAFAKAVGPDGLKKIAELTASCVETEMSNLFSVDPKMSAPSAEQIAAEPDFWKPKVVAPAKKPVVKPTP